MATLLMFSGGLDSTAALHKLLTGSDDELRVHHIHLVNREARSRAEADAAAAVIAWCREHHRPFQYSESTIEFARLEAIPIDYLSVAFVACQVAIDTPGCNRIAAGTLATDPGEIKHRISVKQREVFDSMYAHYRQRKLGVPDMRWIYPVYDFSKAQIVASLPEELRAVAWSCRRPVADGGGYRTCGECKPCLARRDVAAQFGTAV